MEDQDKQLQVTLARIEAKIDQLETDIHVIKKDVHPVWWKKVARFIINNFFTIVTLISLMIFAWKAWELYQNIIEQINEVKSMPGAAYDSIKEIPSNAGNSIREIIKGFGF